MRALIIEDQFIVGTLIEDVLRGMGFSEFDHVDNERDAVRAALANCPDFMAADQRLVDGTGVNAVVAICAAHGPIATVFITEYRNEVRQSLPNAVIIGKPVRDGLLKEAVASAFLQAGIAHGS